MIDDSLKQLGFSDKEIRVYLAILKRGKVLPAEVAKLTGLNRSTVYSVAGELKKRGIIAEDLGGSVGYLVALPPQDLMQLAYREEKLLEQKKRIIHEAIKGLETVVAHSAYQPPKITFVAQEEIAHHLRKRTLAWNESIMKSDKTWWGFQDHAFVNVYQEWIDWYWTRAVPDGMHLILLSNESETEREMKKKRYMHREIRFWKEAGQFTATIWVCGDYLIMISNREEPYSLVEIHDPTLAGNMREVFKGIHRGMMDSKVAAYKKSS